MQVEENSVFEVFQVDRQIHNCVEEGTLYPDVKKSIGKIIKNEGYLTFKIHVEALTADGGNFLGKLFLVKVTGRTDAGEQETHIFIKQALSEVAFQTHMSMSEAYLREVFFYTELNALYKKMQTDANIETHEMLKTVKCYDESSTDAIILENLKVKGFNVLFRMDVMSLKFAEAAIKELAKFHALSFVVQKKIPDYFNSKLKAFKPVLQFNEYFEQFTSKSVKLAIERLDEPVKEKITNNYSDLFSKFAQYTSDTNLSVNCLCHGDFRANNILMRENDDATVEVIPIDYQLIFYGSPITDLIYLLYTGTDRTFRTNHENDLKELYFQNDIPDFEHLAPNEVDLKIDERYFPRIAEICDEFEHLLQF
ncbi:uncharacterized protein LOC119828185 [Zerene cesonia]|uniref:uncharacterized protein LOC119828185 n=1 Tax=Zerene cesonia TaxID=33412 RepID=UPI0018E50842|nr:uncharacterized protein LOC119828185 [Zerene cesonia]